MTQTRWFRIALVAAAAIVVVGVGFGLGRMTAGGGEQTAEVQQLWTCPMHPEYIAEEPGECPICGMDLVPVDSIDDVDEHADHSEMIEGLSTVHLTDARRQLTGVTTVNAQSRSLDPSVRTVGIVKADESQMRTVNAKIGGWVEKLYVAFEGDRITAGQPMLTIYSPELYQTQQEYLAALAARRKLASSSVPEIADTGRQMVESAERRLRLWDIPQGVIDRLRRGGQPQRTVTLHAPVSGVVVRHMVEAGAEIKPGMPLLHVVDLSSVWVEADIYEQDLALVDEGQIATVSFNAYPGETWRGRVEHVYPYLEGSTRTMKARLTLHNADAKLKPEMYAEVVIEGDGRSVLAVPADAVIDIGQRRLVYVETQEGVYEPREVRTGVSRDGWVEILSGLSERQAVVERGLFMIDSESRLRATVSRAGSGEEHDDEAAGAGAGHQH
ncbi:MAG: efflux RND transporter periplasmic adaptor subunit [Armatimonadota bacterium]|jgi:multidrug efflux pump subunit AcrA (membrane-fusion protein)